MLLPKLLVAGTKIVSRSKPIEPKPLRRFRPRIEWVEDRLLLATFMVANLNDAGPGSLREALTQSNAIPGGNEIDFAVAGTITLTSGDLPAITSQVNINGTTAPGFERTPVVEIDANGFAGLTFALGSGGSELQSLAVDNASGAGVTLNDSRNIILGNFIGLGLDGSTPESNQGDGLVVNPTSLGNSIGATTTAVPGITANAISVASNVISSNKGNGIAIHGSLGNVLIANYVGTDVTGTLDRGNAGSGLVMDDGARVNSIGGTTTFNDSSGALPDTNILSGNGGNGVLLTGDAHDNFLGSNFIGTDVTGNKALGNNLDGVAILDGAYNNLVAGTFVYLDPFVFANVISGNHGNGISVVNANGNTIHANYIGIGIDNQTPVGNALDGLLVAGTSANTQFGGVIPLGTVSAANGENGVEIRDQASGTVVFNTFAGEAAFQPFTNLGNHGDGMLVTSTGLGNIIRTNVISNNHANGIEISGDATGLQVTDDIIGLNTNQKMPMREPNYRNGILISGNAHNIAIGGFQLSVIFQNVVSGNVEDGIAIVGNAHDNQIFNSYIGVNQTGTEGFGNGGSGVFIGGDTFHTTIGGANSPDGNLISGNRGNGITLAAATTGNTILDNLIGTNFRGTEPIPNLGNGIFIDNSSNNTVGGPDPENSNTIAFNMGAGVFVNAGTGDAILGNSIDANVGSGIVLQPGANNNQRPPLLTHIKQQGSQTGIGGRLFGAPNAAYLIQFFSSNPKSTSGPPQGETYLGSTTLQTNSQGVARIRFFVRRQLKPLIFTSTATSAGNDTSQFSNGVPVRISKFR